MVEKHAVRVDVFLKESHLVKRRSIAKELCNEGAIRVNGRLARAGQQLVVHDFLTLSLWSRRLELEVMEIPGRSLRAVLAQDLYRIVSESRIGSFDDDHANEAI